MYFHVFPLIINQAAPRRVEMKFRPRKIGKNVGTFNTGFIQHESMCTSVSSIIHLQAVSKPGLGLNFSTFVLNAGLKMDFHLWSVKAIMRNKGQFCQVQRNKEPKQNTLRPHVYAPQVTLQARKKKKTENFGDIKINRFPLMCFCFFLYIECFPEQPFPWWKQTTIQSSKQKQFIATESFHMAQGATAAAAWGVKASRCPSIRQRSPLRPNLSGFTA